MLDQSEKTNIKDQNSPLFFFFKILPLFIFFLNFLKLFKATSIISYVHIYTA